MALYEQFTCHPTASARRSPPAPPALTSCPRRRRVRYMRMTGLCSSLLMPLQMSLLTHLKGSTLVAQEKNLVRLSLSSQTNSNTIHAGASLAECTSRRRVDNFTKNSSGKKLANDDEFMIPSICSPRFPQHSTQQHAGVQEKSNTLCAPSPHKSPPAMSKSPAKCYNSVNKHSERINVSDMRSRSSPKSKEKEPAKALKSVEVEEKSSSIQASKDRPANKVAKICSKKDKMSDINDSGMPRLGNSGRQAASMNGSSMKTQNPTTTKDTVSCKPCTDLDNTKNNLREAGNTKNNLREAGAKRKRSLVHHDVEEDDDSSDASVECIPGWEMSPDEIVGAIGSKHFWKARTAIQNYKPDLQWLPSWCRS